MLAESLTGKPAPELSNLRGWINTSPLTMEGLKGKVVLLDFWTYSCVNCVRSLPHMKLLHKEYAGDAFVLIGVHTPEFEFEKPPENVASAVKRFGIGYPVAIDSENTTWKLYGNQYWPRQTVVDSKGTVRWEHAGEGDYDKMEDRIRDLLKEVGKQAESKGNTRTNTIERFAFSSKTTPEIYQVCVPRSCTRYIDPREHSRDIPYLNGDWTQYPEYVTHVTPESGYILLKYGARNANAVLGVSDMKTVRVDVQLDGKPIDKRQAGADVQWDSNGSYLVVTENRLYDIVRSKTFETHELKLLTSGEDLRIYTYTFG
ncbi:redoxin domain-containing protein [Candidatus Bathyarchaeota archaeon]|nr:MAG: redoxin domain-containing protein [Candidatus Bathyarchaeota archaeon]